VLQLAEGHLGVRYFRIRSLVVASPNVVLTQALGRVLLTISVQSLEELAQFTA
jgi:hypothetical protein